MASSVQDHNRERQWVCARRMAERRHRLGLTQADVVERLNALGVGTSNRTLSAMEHGQGVDVGRLPELAVALDCTITYLLGLTTEPGQWAPDTVRGPVTVNIDASAPAPAEHGSWVLGPDIPDRHTPELAEPFRA